MYSTVEENLETACKLKESLKEELADIEGFRIDAEYMGAAVLWKYGNYNGMIPITNHTDGSVSLEFPEGVDVVSNGSFHPISHMKTLVDIYYKIENYLKKHGKYAYEFRGHPVYNLRNGIPDS